MEKWRERAILFKKEAILLFFVKENEKSGNKLLIFKVFLYMIVLEGCIRVGTRQEEMIC